MIQMNLATYCIWTNIQKDRKDYLNLKDTIICSGSSRRRDYYDRGYDRGYDDRDYYSRSYR